MRESERLAMRAANARRAWAAGVKAVEAAGFKVEAEFHTVTLDEAIGIAPRGTTIPKDASAGTYWAKPGVEATHDLRDLRETPLVGAIITSVYWDDTARSEEHAFNRGDHASSHWLESVWHEIGHVLFTRPDQLQRNVNQLMFTRGERALTHDAPGVALKVSNYANSGPGEFIAETFAGLMSGKTYDAEVMELYHWLGGQDPKRVGEGSVESEAEK